jgi:hypothetical protein
VQIEVAAVGCGEETRRLSGQRHRMSHEKSAAPAAARRGRGA